MTIKNTRILVAIIANSCISMTKGGDYVYSLIMMSWLHMQALKNNQVYNNSFF